MSFTKVLSTLEAMELTQEIPVVFAELLDLYNNDVAYVKIGVEDGKILVKASPTSSQVHVDSIMGEELEKGAELRYTFSPWYVPESLDAHGEWTDRAEVQQAFWDYLADADRSICLQHNMDIVAGKWVEGATWPFEVTVPVKHPEGDTEHTYPAGTPFLGVIWEPWAWELVKSGEIRGLSIGGTANRAEAELVLDKENDPTGSVQFSKKFADAPFVKFADLVKHGTHDQSTHGNRGSGGQSFSDNYQTAHRPSVGSDGGASLDNVTNGIYPDDVYSPRGLDIYGTGYRELDKKAHALIMEYRGKPNKELRIYRAVPNKIDAEINTGDWVTPVREYAALHGESNLNNDYKILYQDVKAKDIFTSGDSWLEWGYAPDDMAKHGNHNQLDHGNRKGSVGSTVASDIQRFTAEWGGLSVNMVNGAKPTGGFMVAKPPKFSKIVEASDFFDKVKGRKILSDYMKANKKDLATGKNYLGTWLTDGKVFLDVSENIMDKRTATRLGSAHDQIKIWDVVNQKEIDTGGTGGVGKRYYDSSNQGHFGDERQRDRGLRRRALGAFDSWQVDKHGDHDQSTHGNRGGRKAVPPLAPNPPASDIHSPAAVSAATKIRDMASAQEPQTTETMIAVAAEFGGELEGLKDRLKLTDSLARKIDKNAREEYNGDTEKAAAAISDSIRYTMMFNDENYTQGSIALRDKFTADGYEVRSKNYWQEGNPYMGVNMKLKKDGLITEIQLHTPESLRTKKSQLTPRYNKARETADPLERKKLHDEMVAISQAIPFPSQAEMLTSFGTPSFEPYEVA